MKITNSPFSTSRRKVFVPVGEGDAVIWLLFTGGIHPAERTEEVQEKETARDRAARDRLLNSWRALKTREEMIEREAAARQLDVTEAEDQMFSATPDQPKVSVVDESEEPEDGALAVKSPISYIQTEEELNTFFSSAESEEKAKRALRNLKNLIATNVIKSRMGWSVTVEKAKLGSSQLSLKRPLFFALEEGSEILFKDVVVTVSDFVSPQDEFIPVKKITAKVEGTGFLLDDEGKQISGCEWTQEMTDSILIEPQIDAIYNFYQDEDAGGNKALDAAINEVEGEDTTDETESDRLGKSLTPLTTVSSPQESTGKSATTDSKQPVVSIGG